MKWTGDQLRKAVEDLAAKVDAGTAEVTLNIYHHGIGSDDFIFKKRPTDAGWAEIMAGRQQRAREATIAELEDEFGVVSEEDLKKVREVWPE